VEKVLYMPMDIDMESMLLEEEPVDVDMGIGALPLAI
jgi:hypothetical protein